MLDRRQWINRPRTHLLSGLVVALALIPEAISFSIIAGVDPKVGLYASFSIAIIIAFSGGRPGMISAVAALDTLVAKFGQRGIQAELIGMNEHAERLHTRTTGNATVH